MVRRTCARFSGEARGRVTQIGFPAVVELTIGTGSSQESFSIHSKGDLEAMDFRGLFQRAQRHQNAAVTVRKLELLD